MQGKAGLCMLVQKLEIQTHCSCKASSSWPEPYDVMGFQECDNIERIITDAGPRGSSCFWLVQYVELCLNVCRTAEWIHQNSRTSCASNSVWSFLPRPVSQLHVCKCLLLSPGTSCLFMWTHTGWTFVTRQARHRLSQSFMARAGFEAKPLMIAQHSFIAISDVQFMIIYSFFCAFFNTRPEISTM